MATVDYKTSQEAIDMPDIKLGFVRGTQPLGSSLIEWID